MKYSEKSIYYMMDLHDKRFDPLSREEELELLKKYKENKDPLAREELITRNLRFVNKVVRGSFGIICATNFRFDSQTLFQEGVMGLIEALDKFELQKDVRFLSYANYRILKSIWLYIYDNSSSMSGCMSLFRDYNRINNILKKNPELTYEEVSERLKGFRSPRGIENVINMVESKSVVPTYDHLVTSEGEEHSLIEISTSVDMEKELDEVIYNKELKELINTMMNDKAIFVNEKSRVYFREYFLEGKSYREIAEKHNVSHQAVQQSVTKRIDYIKRNYAHLLIEFYK